MSDQFELLKVIGGKSNLLNHENLIFNGNTIIIEKDTGKFKCGDGKQPYQQLEYSGKNTLNDEIVKRLTTLNVAGSYAFIDKSGNIPDTIISKNIMRLTDTVMVAGNAENADMLFQQYTDALKNE